MEDPVFKKRDQNRAAAADQKTGTHHIAGTDPITDDAVEQLSYGVEEKADRGEKTGVLLGEKGFFEHFRGGDAQHIAGDVVDPIYQNANAADAEDTDAFCHFNLPFSGQWGRFLRRCCR